MTPQDKLAAIAWPAGRAEVRHWQHDETGRMCWCDVSPGEHWHATGEPVFVFRYRYKAAIALLAVCQEWIEADGDVHREPCLKNRDVYEHPCVCGRDALIAKFREVLDRE